jgi:hypothetical protein
VSILSIKLLSSVTNVFIVSHIILKIFFYRDSDDDDEEFDMQQVKNVAPVTAKTALLSVSEVTALDVALKRYQRDGYFAKYLIREVDVNGKYTKIGSGGFGDVFKAKYKPIGPLKEPSEWSAIKRMVLNNKTLHVVIKEY